MSDFFIFGCSRSGTTLLASMLNAHPEVIIPGETWWIAICRAMGLSSFSSKYLTSKFLSLVQDNIVQSGNEDWITFVNDFSKANSSFRGGYDHFFRLFVAAAKLNFDTKYFCEKTPSHTTYITEIFDKFPEFKKIILLRDPRDIVCSYYSSLIPRGVNSLANILITLKDYMLHMIYAMQHENCIVIKYEELTINPDIELTKICRALNIDYCLEMLNFKPTTAATGIHRNLNRNIFTNSSNYLMKLSSDEIFAIEYVLQ